MFRTHNSKSPSILLREQIKNISHHMQVILANVMGMKMVKSRFSIAKNEAYDNCSKIDHVHSISAEEEAVDATYILINKLVQLKNEAIQLVKDQQNSQELLQRFQEHMDYVEQMIKDSIQPFINGSPLNKKANHNALAILEQWSELYRHGLKASGDIPQRGEDWLEEVNHRIDATAAVLQQLQAEKQGS